MGFLQKPLRLSLTIVLLVVFPLCLMAVSRTGSVVPFEKPVAVVVLDAGHGGQDPGAIYNWPFAPDGVLSEKDLTLELALLVKDQLSKADPALEILMTRDADFFLPLDERAAYARRIDPGLERSLVLVSIHVNSATSPEASGFEILMKQLTKRVRFLDSDAENWQISRYAAISNTELNQALNRSNLLLAQSMQSALASAFPQSRNRGVKEQDVWVLNASNVTSILVEVGFISNAQDALEMVSYNWKQAMALAMVDGILDYIRVSR